jgi:hypothetical protein
MNAQNDDRMRCSIYFIFICVREPSITNKLGEDDGARHARATFFNDYERDCTSLSGGRRHLLGSQLRDVRTTKLTRSFLKLWLGDLRGIGARSVIRIEWRGFGAFTLLKLPPEVGNEP